jgi:hypothetical protein
VHGSVPPPICVDNIFRALRIFNHTVRPLLQGKAAADAAALRLVDLLWMSFGEAHRGNGARSSVAPARAEAIRHLVELGLKAKGK